ncbi:hypothetical protein BAE44_0016236 [Dichanthelium oligosanthes]|uniref:Cystatin domain-containing protein n=1 Tax=Dichanthelium oligosanthes TaxID=888268 RepID=A0A1E5VC62_9POAL|nr:hypothetical protein BAE44_0016236 [Dichanthelium oligosanthes]
MPPIVLRHLHSKTTFILQTLKFYWYRRIMASPTMRTGLLFSIAVIAISVAIPTMADLGEWHLININDPDMQELGRWAVAEHVKQANDGIKFNKLVSGREQVAVGINFDLIIDAWNSDGKDAKGGGPSSSPTVSWPVSKVSKEAETYNITVKAPERVKLIVTPTTLEFKEPKERKSYRVEFRNEARGNRKTGWGSGHIHWQNENHRVRSPVAFHWKN